MFLGSPHRRGIAAGIDLVAHGSANKRRYDREPARRAKTIRIEDDSAPATSMPKSSVIPRAQPNTPLRTPATGHSAWRARRAANLVPTSKSADINICMQANNPDVL